MRLLCWPAAAQLGCSKFVTCVAACKSSWACAHSVFTTRTEELAALPEAAVCPLPVKRKKQLVIFRLVCGGEGNVNGLLC